MWTVRSARSIRDLIGGRQLTMMMIQVSVEAQIRRRVTLSGVLSD